MPEGIPFVVTAFDCNPRGSVRERVDEALGRSLEEGQGMGSD
jgi:hypothetical protein